MRLQEWREREQLSRAVVAQTLDVSAETVRLWECGQFTPRLDVAMRIEKMTGGKVALRDLVNEAAE